MAKKVVATLQKGGKNFTKVIKMVKNPVSGGYGFKEAILHNDDVKNFLKD